MSSTAVVGLQWGDEAKGKLVDLLADKHDIVVRYQGGNNAGHTVTFQGQTYKLSLLPVGVLHSHLTSVIAGGVVVNPRAMLGELDGLKERGIEPGARLMLSSRAHVIFPYHVAEEAVLERARKESAIGTTGRGIGTCYRDKVGRTHAIRVGDLYNPIELKTKLNDIVHQKNTMLKALDPAFEPQDAAAILDEYLGYAERIKIHVADTTAFLHKAIKAGKKLLFEGAQGSLLDIDHGTFPFVTSSNSSGSGIHSGSGVPERYIQEMIGVVKAYSTRVGGGPFPTELDNEIGQHIRDVGREYGTVTGRPRRCGWFDSVAAGYGARISGVNSIAIMLLDVLSQLDEVKVCVAYDIRGERTTDFPAHVDDLAAAKPVYETLPGWKTEISGMRKLEQFPANARKYLDKVSELLETPVRVVSIGPDREQTVWM